MSISEVNCLKYVVDAIDRRNIGVIVFNNIKNDNTLLKLLKEVKLNTNETQFPDFLSGDAIVEHFSITSSRENRKGSSFKISQSKNNNDVENSIEEWRSISLSQPFEDNTVKTTVIKNTYGDFSYVNFIDSFCRNLSHHIDSLNKYDVKGRKVVFLIELQDAPMGIYLNGKFSAFYKLCEDRNAMEVLKQYKELIDVIIFKASHMIEIIDIEKFDIIYDSSRYQEDVRGGRRIENKVLLNIDIKI